MVEVRFSRDRGIVFLDQAFTLCVVNKVDLRLRL